MYLYGWNKRLGSKFKKKVYRVKKKVLEEDKSVHRPTHCLTNKIMLARIEYNSNISTKISEYAF